MGIWAKILDFFWHRDNDAPISRQTAQFSEETSVISPAIPIVSSETIQTVLSDTASSKPAAETVKPESGSTEGGLGGLSMIEGLGDEDEKKLSQAGCVSLEKFLELCKTKRDRQALSKQTGIEESLILKWANHADLIRINGIGGKYAVLLEAAGVDTVPELAMRNAVNLHKKIVEVNGDDNFVKRIPNEQMVKDWIDEAKVLPRMLTY